MRVGFSLCLLAGLCLGSALAFKLEDRCGGDGDRCGGDQSDPVDREDFFSEDRMGLFGENQLKKVSY